MTQLKTMDALAAAPASLEGASDEAIRPFPRRRARR